MPFKIVARLLRRDRKQRAREDFQCLLSCQLDAAGLRPEREHLGQVSLWNDGQPEARSPAPDTCGAVVAADGHRRVAGKAGGQVREALARHGDLARLLDLCRHRQHHGVVEDIGRDAHHAIVGG